MTEMLRPPPLRRREKVRIVAPAGWVDAVQLQAGLDLLVEAGLTPVWDPALLQPDRYFAGSISRRRHELVAALHDADARAIWAARGGYGTAQLLADVCVADLVRHPKWLVGFSDITGLHGRWQHAGLLSMHAANVTTLSCWSGAARQALFDLLGLRGEQAAHKPQHFIGSCHSQDGLGGEGSKAVRGRLWGGNLTVLASLVGGQPLPPLNPPHGPSILLLEDIGEAPYRLDRAWQQLYAAHALEGVVAVAVGQLTRCEARGASYTATEMLGAAIGRSGLPWVGGLPFGHDNDAQPVLLGSMATLDAAARHLSVWP